jgi:anti-sigma regulatory factor (Ser/Thr protein kinase)
VKKNLPPILLLSLNIFSIEDVVSARQRARQISELLNFDITNQMRIATVVSEIARNAFQYAGGGKVCYCLQNHFSYSSLMVKISDKGPGITDLQKVLSGQYISKTGNGAGIIGSKKIMDNFTITTELGKGATVVAEMNLPKNASLITSQFLEKITNELAEYKPKNAFDEVQKQNQELLQALTLLNKARDELDQRVQECTRQLQQEIIEKKRIEELFQQHQIELARAEIINSMGEMASALAHELSQPLTAIITYTQGCIIRFEKDNYQKEELLHKMNRVVQRAQCAGEIIHRFAKMVSTEAWVKLQSGSQVTLPSPAPMALT